MEKKITEKLGQALRSQRKKCSLTQKELGDFAGCGEAFIHLLEHGKPTVRLDKVLDILKVLGLQLRLELGKEGITLDPQLT